MWQLACAAGGYLIGGFNPSYIIAKIKGFDIRKNGSGNAGGSNALITMGNKIGVLCMVLDILKAYFTVKLAKWLLPETLFASQIASVAVILGHMFPIYMQFRGGKGLACLGGVVLAYDPTLFVIMLSIGVVLAFVTDYICVVPLSACVVFPIIYGIFEKDLWGALVFLPATIAMIYKHLENIKRIFNKTEAHFSYLWSKDEKVRVMRNEAKRVSKHSKEEKENNSEQASEQK